MRIGAPIVALGTQQGPAFGFTIRATDSLACTGTGAFSIRATSCACVIAGEGLSQTNGNRVRVFDGAGNPTGVDFFAYDVNVAGGNLGY